MGKKPDQIENEIRQHRAEMTRRMDALQERIQDQVATTRDDTKARVSGAMGEARTALKPDTLMQERPLSALAGALGVGVLLGVVSEGFGSGGGGRQEQRFSESRSNGSGAGLAGLLTYIAGPAAQTAQNELQQLVREGFDSIKSQVDGAKQEGIATQERDREFERSLPIE